MTLLERMRGLAADHGPDAWPAVQMKDISELCDLVEQAQQQCARAERRAIMFGDQVTNLCIALQAALIADWMAGPREGMRWVFNSLVGPGLLPDGDAARAMGGAQAWFDVKMAEQEGFRLANPGVATSPYDTALRELLRVCPGGDLWNQGKLPTEEEYQAALKRAQDEARVWAESPLRVTTGQPELGETHQQRVLREHRELTVKVNALSSFIDSPKFRAIAPIDQRLLVLQRRFMEGYQDTLLQRMEAFMDQQAAAA